MKTSATPSKPRLAFWFRYGPAEHAELCHSLPIILDRLSQSCAIWYFGMKTFRPVPPQIARHIRLVELPLRVNRHAPYDKLLKTILWVALLPFVGLCTRFLGVRVVFIDETIPFTVWAARIFSGARIVVTVADFFADIYLAGSGPGRRLASLIKAADFASWRRADRIITIARNAGAFLEQHGVPRERIVSIYDPCDFNLYHPMNKAEQRRRWGYGPGDVVLVHHGILHPNKGNSWIVRRLAEARPSMPYLHYLLVGDGPEMEELKSLVQALQLGDRVRLTGWLPGPHDVNSALNAGDIGLVMRIGQKSDDFHMTGALVHNMAAGLPILAARLGGVAEVVEPGVNGLLFDPRDPAEFLACLERLASNAGLRERMGEKALDAARLHFDLDRAGRQTAETLLSVLGP